MGAPASKGGKPLCCAMQVALGTAWGRGRCPPGPGRGAVPHAGPGLACCTHACPQRSGDGRPAAPAAARLTGRGGDQRLAHFLDAIAACAALHVGRHADLALALRDAGPAGGGKDGGIDGQHVSQGEELHRAAQGQAGQGGGGGGGG